MSLRKHWDNLKLRQLQQQARQLSRAAARSARRNRKRVIAGLLFAMALMLIVMVLGWSKAVTDSLPPAGGCSSMRHGGKWRCPMRAASSHRHCRNVMLDESRLAGGAWEAAPSDPTGWAWIERRLGDAAGGCEVSRCIPAGVAVSASLFIGHSHQRMLAFSYCTTASYGSTGRRAANATCNHYTESRSVPLSYIDMSPHVSSGEPDSPRAWHLSATTSDDGVSEIVRVCAQHGARANSDQGEVCRKPLVALMLRSCDAYMSAIAHVRSRGVAAAATVTECPPASHRLLTGYIKAQFGAQDRTTMPLSAADVLNALPWLPESVGSFVVYARGSWDLQYNDTRPHDVLDASVADVADSIAPHFAKSAPRPAFFIQPPHANHAVDASRSKRSPAARRWLDTCRGLPRNMVYRAVSRLAACGVSERLNGAMVNPNGGGFGGASWTIGVVDPIEITESAGASAPDQRGDQAPGRASLVDESGHHYSELVLGITAAKLARFACDRSVVDSVLDDRICGVSAVADLRRIVERWEPNESCGARALRCAGQAWDTSANLPPRHPSCSEYGASG